MDLLCSSRQVFGRYVTSDLHAAMVFNQILVNKVYYNLIGVEPKRAVTEIARSAWRTSRKLTL
jgi:hypothetical protein